jgi:hypothetical protein
MIFFDNDFLGPGQSNIQSMIPLLRDPRVNLLGVSVVTGDAWMTEETAHLLRFLEIAGRPDVPVYKGSPMPLLRTQAEMANWEARFGRIPFKGAWNAPRPGRTYHPDEPDLIPRCRKARPPSSPATRARSRRWSPPCAPIPVRSPSLRQAPSPILRWLFGSHRTSRNWPRRS